MTTESLHSRETLPPVLYKFRDWANPNHRRLLTEKEIYLASPKSFNDPFDCRLPLPFLDIEYKYVQKIVDHKLKTHMSRIDRLFAGYHIGTAIQKERYKPSGPEIAQQSVIRSFENFGVFSLSANRANLLLWAHYAASHSGFCVGYNSAALREWVVDEFSSRQLQHALVNVIYQSAFPVLTMNSDDLTSVLISALSTKSNDWAYEQESRLLVMNSAGSKFMYPNHLIKHVILGIRMSEESRDEIVSFCNNETMPIEVFQARRSATQFGLEFENIS